MKLKLSSDIVSSEDLKALMNEIAVYAKWFRHNEIKMHITNQQATGRPMLSDAAADMLEQAAKPGKLTANMIDELLKELNAQFKAMPRVRITLAAMPTGAVKHKLAGWCRDNISPTLLIDFRYNASILGGMVVNLGSRTYDWSFRSRLMESREKLAEAFSSVR